MPSEESLEEIAARELAQRATNIKQTIRRVQIFVETGNAF
jgi:hypothetical protein